MTEAASLHTVHNLSLPVLKAAYLRGDRNPRDLMRQLSAQARRQSAYNAWIYLLNEAELEPYLSALEAHTPDTLPLYGVPFAIKDNIDLAGIPTTAACPDFAYIPGASAAVVSVLIAAGAIPLGKTNLDQFATGLVGTRSPYGEGKNSFNPEVYFRRQQCRFRDSNRAGTGEFCAGHRHGGLRPCARGIE